jgi:cyclopropane fatty-acyl-phospholipid synthase-like methyltransferase
VLYDLGSGDGRIVIEAARRFGTRGVGVDLNPVRVEEATANARRAGVQDRVRFRPSRTCSRPTFARMNYDLHMGADHLVESSHLDSRGG